MRLLFGLVLWVTMPFYIVTGLVNGNLDPGFAIVGSLLAVGMAVGEWTRYQNRERRKAAERAQQEYWIAQGRR